LLIAVLGRTTKKGIGMLYKLNFVCAFTNQDLTRSPWDARNYKSTNEGTWKDQKTTHEARVFGEPEARNCVFPFSLGSERLGFDTPPHLSLEQVTHYFFTKDRWRYQQWIPHCNVRLARVRCGRGFFFCFSFLPVFEFFLSPTS